MLEPFMNTVYGQNYLYVFVDEDAESSEEIQECWSGVKEFQPLWQ